MFVLVVRARSELPKSSKFKVRARSELPKSSKFEVQSQNVFLFLRVMKRNSTVGDRTGGAATILATKLRDFRSLFSIFVSRFAILLFFVDGSCSMVRCAAASSCSGAIDRGVSQQQQQFSVPSLSRDSWRSGVTRLLQSLLQIQ